MKKLLTLLTISTLLVIPTSTGFLINKDSNVTRVTYYRNNSNEVETKINEVWNKNFKNQLDSAKKFKWILEDLKQKIKTSNLGSVDIKLEKETEQNNRFKFNTNDQKFVIKVDGKTISLQTGTVKKAWKAMKYKGRTHGEDTLTKESELDTSKWTDTNFEVYEIGYYDDGNEIQAIKLPHGVVKVPDHLPKEITSTRELFNKAANFNDPNVKNWDVSNIKDMQSMFDDAKIFNQDLDKWNTSNVTDMSFMFRGANAFNGKVSNWNTSNVSTMTEMFREAKNFNQDINTKIIKDKNKYSLSWNVSNVTKMQAMFEDATNFNSELHNWNTSKVTVMRDMFKNATSFNKNISNFNINKVQDFTDMFKDATTFNQDISNWIVDKVQVTHLDNKNNNWKSHYRPRTKEQATQDNKKIEKWLNEINKNFLNTTDLLYNEEFTKLIEKHNIETEAKKVEAKINEIWNKEYKDKLDSAKKFKWILDEIKEKLKKKNLLKTTTIDLLNKDESKNRFKFNEPKASSVTKQSLKVKVNGKELDLDPGKVKRAWKPMKYKGKYHNHEDAYSKADEFDASKWDDHNFIVYEIGYYDNGKEIQAIKLPHGVVKVPEYLPKEITSTKELFADANQFNDQSIKKWDVSNVEDMSGMFSRAASFNQNINDWNVSNVSNMSSLFEGSRKFNSELSKWNTSHVTSMAKMFKDAKTFNQNIANFDIKNVMFFNNMFENATSFNQNLSSWSFKHLKDKLNENTNSYDLNAASWKAEWKPDANSNKPAQPVVPVPQPQPAPKPVEPTPQPPVKPAPVPVPKPVTPIDPTPTPITPVQPDPVTPPVKPIPQPVPVPVEPTPTPPVQPQPVPDKPFIRPLIPIRPINPNDNKITLSEIIKKDQLGEINFRSANEILKKIASLNKDINIYELVVTNITKNSAIVSARLDSDYIGSVLVSFNIKKPQAIKWEKPIFNTTDDWFLYPVISNNKNIIDPVKPEKPTEPIKPDKPNKPTNPSNPITPNKPDKPADNKPTTPTTPTNNKKPEVKKVNNNKAAFIGIGVTLLAIILISSVALILKRKKK
ncbi:BspA family leucine-rich repeat surface protein [Mycoplasma feriruminatoris]|uniref:Filamentous hemagglutinin n=1 Tax=Mycoplasma feriruminatoris TaxID=1179777 RepID=A0A654IMU0_9MOLU|nr:Filamentous hemagglutinin [Mycoplasma feriruminatoris]